MEKLLDCDSLGKAAKDGVMSVGNTVLEPFFLPHGDVPGTLPDICSRSVCEFGEEDSNCKTLALQASLAAHL